MATAREFFIKALLPLIAGLTSNYSDDGAIPLGIVRSICCMVTEMFILTTLPEPTTLLIHVRTIIRWLEGRVEKS